MFQPEIIVKSRKNTSTFSTAGRAMTQFGGLPVQAGKGVFHGVTGVFKGKGSKERIAFLSPSAFAIIRKWFCELSPLSGPLLRPVRQNNVVEDGGEATEGPGTLGWSLGDCEGGVPSPGGGGMPFGLRSPASLRPLRVYGRFAGPIS